MDNQHTFIQRRQMFEQDYFKRVDDNILRSITVVDLSTTDFCNRTCVFCPRHDPKVYPNRSLHMTSQGAEIIASKLSDIDFKGTVAISGFGENLINPNIVEIIRVLRRKLPDAFIECNTNGDPLKSLLASQLIDMGLDCININLYDGPEQVQKFDLMLQHIPKEKYKYRVHWGDEDFGLHYNNRSGVVKWIPYKNNEVMKGCYYPFYKLFVDWNGDVLFCANDWGRENVIGNLMQQTIDELWLSSAMKKIRTQLATKGRIITPCNSCNINGGMVGKLSFNRFMEFYEKEDTGNG